MRRVIFLDRDGTIIKEKNFIVKTSQVIILPSALRGLRLLKKAGYKFVIFTNQSGIARGVHTEKTLRSINQHIRRLFKSQGITFGDFYYCPHHPEGIVKQYRKACNCRKPKPGMLLRAKRDLKIDLKKSFVIGDSWRDLAAGKKVKACSILVLTGKGRRYLDEIEKPRLPPAFGGARIRRRRQGGLKIADCITPNLLTAARWIIARGTSK